MNGQCVSIFFLFVHFFLKRYHISMVRKCIFWVNQENIKLFEFLRGEHGLLIMIKKNSSALCGKLNIFFQAPCS